MKNTYMNKTLIELVDDTLHEIASEQWCASEGCDTCGWGSSYITEINFMFDNCYVHIEDNEAYDYGELSGAFFMKFFIDNLDKIKLMTFDKFLQFTTAELEKVCSRVTVEVNNYYS